jgi:hypothetical protein
MAEVLFVGEEFLPIVEQLRLAHDSLFTALPAGRGCARAASRSTTRRSR